MTAARDRLLATVLAGAPVFAGVDEPSLLGLARASVRRSLKKRQRLYARGERGDALIVVLAGRIDIVRADTVLRSLSPGALIGFSTLAGATHSADLVAAEPSEVLIVGGKHVRALFASKPDLPLAMMAALAKIISDLSDDVEALRADDIEARAKKKLMQLLAGKRELAVTHGELAKMIGASRSNTSRALKKLEQQGLLVRRRGRIVARG